jgi:hypothetical protein
MKAIRSIRLPGTGGEDRQFQPFRAVTVNERQLGCLTLFDCIAETGWSR